MTSARTAPDLLHVPVLGRLLRWRWGRLAFQIPLLLVAALVLYDGITGPQLAPLNLATVLVWIHYRGGVMLALLLVGNLFCMGCPFSLLRTVAPRLARHGRRWPRILRNKWGALALVVILLWVYEWLDLWGNPLLTAGLALAYFVAAFALEILFRESPFCKYLCPLGAFNTTYSTLSPLQIRSRDRDRCRTCANHECVNGSATVPGCGTELFVPQIQSNVDCILCLDCARACPFDNVALRLRRPGSELGAFAWRKRWDLAFLVLVLAFSGVSNAFGMVPPVYTLEAALSEWLNVNSEALILLLIFGVGNVLMPIGLGLLAAAASRTLAGKAETLRTTLSRFAPAFVPLGFGIWFGHYTYHFATGALTILPVLQNFALDHGIALLGETPNWRLGAILPSTWILPLQMLAVAVGLVASLNVLNRTGRRDALSRSALLPWLLLLVLLAVAGVLLFTQPMEMRGSIQFGH